MHPPAEQASAVKRPKSETAEASFRSKALRSVSFYIDGFNLYHAIDDLRDNRLKWVDLASLCQSYLRDGDRLSTINYFTAINRWDKAKRARHVAYIDALEHTGVNVHRGTFDRPPKFCHEKGDYCRNYSEKQSDVGIAVSMIADGFEGTFEKAFLITADSDQVPLAKRFKTAFPDRRLLLITPPKRYSEARDLVNTVGLDRTFKLTAGRIRQHILPDEFRKPNGKLLVARPAAYSNRC